MAESSRATRQAQKEQQERKKGKAAGNLPPGPQLDPERFLARSLAPEDVATVLSDQGHADKGSGDAIARTVLDMQRRYGNQRVERVLAGYQPGDKGPKTPLLTPATVRAAEEEAQREEGYEVSTETGQRIEKERASGQLLPPETRHEMEDAFAAEFGEVRVHTGAAADQLNREVDAEAFTSGAHVFFKAGDYSPQSERGKGLLAHELAHVAGQQGGVRRRVFRQQAPTGPAPAAPAPAATATAAAAPSATAENYTLKNSTVVIPKDIQPKVKKVADEYHTAKGGTLVITDGARTAGQQAQQLLNKLKGDGEAKVKKLYANKTLIGEIITAYKSKTKDAERLKAMTETIEKQIKAGNHISKHLLNNAVDVRSSGIDKATLETATKNSGGTLVDETDTSNPHYHLQW